MSSAFSGIDTPCTALECLGLGAMHELGDCAQQISIQNMHAVEWLSKSQAQLRRAPNGPKCLFTDIDTFWTDDFKPKIEKLLEQGRFVEVMKDLLPKADHNVLKGLIHTYGYCVNCDKMCDVTLLR